MLFTHYIIPPPPSISKNPVWGFSDHFSFSNRQSGWLDNWHWRSKWSKTEIGELGNQLQYFLSGQILSETGCYDQVVSCKRFIERPLPFSPLYICRVHLNLDICSKLFPRYCSLTLLDLLSIEKIVHGLTSLYTAKSLQDSLQLVPFLPQWNEISLYQPWNLNCKISLFGILVLWVY